MIPHLATPRTVSRLLALAACSAAASSASADLAFRVVQRSDAACPGLGAAVTFSSMSGAWLTPSGRAYYDGDLLGGLSADDAAACVETSMISKALVLHKDAQIPGAAAGVTADYAFGTIINDLNQLLMSVDLVGPGVAFGNNQAYLGGSAFNPSMLVRTGMQAGGLPAGVVYGNLLECGMNNVGKLVFSSELIGTGVNSENSLAIFTGLPNALVPAMRYGNQAIGMPAGVTYGGIVYYSPDLNNGGEMAFTSHLVGASIIAGVNDSGAWFGHPGALTTIARAGNAAPGMAAGVKYGPILDHPRINNANQIALITKLQGTGVNANNDTAVFFGTSAALSPLVREGAPLPEQPLGVNIGEIDYAMPNDTGLVAASVSVFGLGVNADNDEAWVAARPGGLITTIFRNGDAAPSLPGVIYGHPFITSMQLNSSNLVAYTALLTGPTVTSANGHALFAGTPGNPGPLIRAGDVLEIAPGDFRTVSNVTLASGYSNGVSSPTNLSSGNQVACTVYFTNNTSAILVATICPADFNHSKLVSVQDIFDFLAAYFAGDMRADINASLTVSVQDIFDYLARYFSGC